MVDAAKLQRQPRFVSLRWRLLLPLFIVILIAAMTGAYVLANTTAGSLQIPQESILLQSSRAITERAAAFYSRQHQEAQRAALTPGVAEAAQAANRDALEKLLAAPARIAQPDRLIITDSRGIELLGLARTSSRGDYAASAGTDFGSQAVVPEATAEAATGLLHTAETVLLYTAVPIRLDGKPVGAIVVGHRLERVLNELRGSSVINAALFTEDGALIAASLPLDEPAQAALRSGIGGVVPLKIGGEAYTGTAFPFQYGPHRLGLMAAFAPETIPAAVTMGRQVAGLAAALIAGAVVVVVFAGINAAVVSRMNRVAAVANELARGQAFARTSMQPTDEIGAVGQALDRYADYVQKRHDSLRASLRRQRREAEHLNALLESLPDGIIVQDSHGRVLLINEAARKLLGSHRVFRSSGLSDLNAAITNVLGPSLAPGLYTLGDPRRVELDDKMLSAQAAAVMDLSNERVGTVIVLRDITQDVRLERARDALLLRFAETVQKPVAEIARAEASRQPRAALPRELARHAITLQKLIAEMRELSGVDTPGVREDQRPLLLDTLLWTVANEWRQIALAANLTLDVSIERQGLYVLGDERRLRWAIGNVVDNAIKYTPPGGKVSLDIRGEANGYALLRVRDSGAGIGADDLPHVFTRFYRGSPVSQSGNVIHVPGMGQGLTTARQIVEGHGGRIEIRSKPGVGTAVFMALPLTASVGLEMPHLPADLDGETVQIREPRLLDES